MPKNTITVAFAGGGTGGHIYPGLAVADELRAIAKEKDLPLRIVWIGNSKGMDRRIVEKSKSTDLFIGIPCGKLRRYFSFQNFIDLFKIAFGIIKAFFILLKIRPKILFSKGGFVSVPPCVAAKLLKIKILTHECDFTPGLATKINSRFATKILLSYSETKKYFNQNLQKKTLVTGNPIRPSFYSANAEAGLDFLGLKKNSDSKPILLVLGGSLGAHQLNTLVMENIEWLTEHFELVHQTGANDFELCKTKSNIKNYHPYDFIYSQMPDVLACADIVLSRSGAGSIWESAVLHKPMLLVPLCGSGTRGDQVDNAKFFEKAGSALVLYGEQANSSGLKEKLNQLLSEEKRKQMSLSLDSILPKERSAKIIAELLGEMCK